ncbi:hypothetical protein SAMN02745165_03601 [Malonomonas rubra DSM 5091]|uniref:Uncharacterized protein n=1 Tax=Malonomonas rubra DSM 5091 TaxID=1122189 RepID=A0A1M6NFY7_MALRU|nr:hypothetical protein [Malonomonas rubra]SHJ94516.1 hypothetical protein SAMN02745165_03601 [Malonomonas rubra DSM 5091]
MSDKTCEAFIDDKHIPTEENMIDGVPKNSLSSLLRVCMDERSERCVYHKRLALDTEYYLAQVDLCFYAYRKI